MQVLVRNKELTSRQIPLREIDLGCLNPNKMDILKDGRNIEICARIIANKEELIVSKDPELTTRTVVYKNRQKYLLRFKTDKGFDLAPAKMKGTGRTRDDIETQSFIKNNRFLLIEVTHNAIRYRFLDEPNKILYNNIND